MELHSPENVVHGHLGALIKDKLYLAPSQIPDDGCVFVLYSSYGAEIIAICADVQVGLPQPS